MELSDYIRARVRPRAYKASPEEERRRPSLTGVARRIGIDPRLLHHMLVGKANWTEERLLAVAGIISGDLGEMRWALARDRARPGALRLKRGQPRKEKCEKVLTSEK